MTKIELLASSWHLISAVAVLLIGFWISASLCKFFDVRLKRAWVLYLWHTAFCLLYLFYVLGNGGDSIAYYRASLSETVSFSPGTDAVRFLTSIFSMHMGMSILGVFLVFNIVGYIGMLATDASIRAAASHGPRQLRRLASLIIFIPSISFWSSAIGKDSISFLAAGLALWSSLDFGRRRFVLAVSIGLMFIVRPHIAAILVIATAMATFVRHNVTLALRFVIGISAAGLAVLVLPYALEYSGIVGDVGVREVVDYVEERQGYNLQGASSIDISSMPLPMQLFTYLFRPLPMEAHNVAAIAASIENVFLLLLTIVGLWRIFEKRGLPATQANSTFLIAYALTCWLVLSITTANLGISMRQKWMFVPMILYVLMAVVGQRRLRYGNHLQYRR